MNAKLHIIEQVVTACRKLRLDNYDCPTWNDSQQFKSLLQRLKRNDTTAWTEFVQRLSEDWHLATFVRQLLIDVSVIQHAPEFHPTRLSFPAGFEQLPPSDEKPFLDAVFSLNRDSTLLAHPVAARLSPDCRHSYKLADANHFVPPKKPARTEIMYVELKTGITGPARIACVSSSKSGRTLYYRDMRLQSLKGAGYKANYYDTELGTHYWISRCRKDGKDSLYSAIVEIDENVREEYWTTIRQQPENSHLKSFRSSGKH
jgi:hypothetical protein